MKIDLTERQCIDIEWSILMAIRHVEKQRKKEKKDLTSPLTKKLLELHDYIKKERTKWSLQIAKSFLSMTQLEKS